MWLQVRVSVSCCLCCHLHVSPVSLSPSSLSLPFSSTEPRYFLSSFAHAVLAHTHILLVRIVVAFLSVLRITVCPVPWLCAAMCFSLSTPLQQTSSHNIKIVNDWSGKLRIYTQNYKPFPSPAVPRTRTHSSCVIEVIKTSASVLAIILFNCST